MNKMENKSQSTLIFFVNGKKITDSNIQPEWTLLYYLRKKCILSFLAVRLYGTKLGCAEGGCGACTVMVSKYDHKTRITTHKPVNACLTPICSIHGLAVTTVEGIGSIKTKLHPIQERLAKAHGSQCGFCTPGIVMSMYTLLRNINKPSIKEIETALQGNLCRCTGYRPIIESFKTFTQEWEVIQRQSLNNNTCAMGEKCCKNQKSVEDEVLYDVTEFYPYSPDQEPIFPPELKLNDLSNESLIFKGETVTFFRPSSLKELLQIKSSHPDAKIIVGNTEIGVEIKFKNCIYPVLIFPNVILELNGYTINEKGVEVGASTTLDNLETVLKHQILSQPEEKTYIFKAIVEMLHYFASKQIRSVASLGGNIITGSPISDLNPIFMAANCEMKLQNSTSSRIVKMDENFYKGYRTTILDPSEILVSIIIPFTKPNQFFYAHKQSRRREDDIAIVNAAFNIKFKPNTTSIEDIRMAFGGLDSSTKLAKITMEALLEQEWNEDMIQIACSNLLLDFPLKSNTPGGMIEFRKTLPISFFFRTYLTIAQKLQKQYPNIQLNAENLSGINRFENRSPTSAQFYQVVSNQQIKNDAVGRPIIHASALKQATGEAIYLDDIPHVDNEVAMAMVFSKKAHANIISIDFTKAITIPDVVGYISSKDLDESVKVGAVHKDEELFIRKTVTSQYQFLGAIVAENELAAKKAANLVKVEYEELSPVIISIEDAIKYKSFFDTERKLEIGNVDEVFKNAKNIIEGECRTGYQEHFYLETHGCLVIPKEGDDLEIYSSTQHPSEDYISDVLGIKRHKVITRVKRIGGGFGGKQSRGAPIALAAAVAAKKFKRPVRLIFDRDDDMAASGGRHPYLSKYKAAFDDEGKILAYDVEVYANSGHSYDLSIEVLERALFHVENAYKIPNLRVKGRLCKTNLPSNTAFRGFGGPQSMFVAENMIRDVAEYLKKDSTEICLKNIYSTGEKTHYNQIVTDCNLEACISQCLETSEYYKRKKEIEIYNKNNRWKKRGISSVCTKYGVGFGVPFLEQAGALVNIYIDGSVLLTHSGVEMGQGLNTKMIQIASRIFEIPVDFIYIAEIATDKVPNTVPTAASVGSDLNGMAVLRACNTIKERLKPIMENNPEGNWEEWIKKAYFERISLSSTGFYCTPDIVYNWDTNTGKPYNYYTFGAACTEVEIDCLTGDHQVLRTDIVMDLGSSLNPAIDIGQIEGAFMQGYGLFVLEELVVSAAGTIYSKGPGAYKIPGFGDIPIEFNVALLKGSSNPRAVYSSKAVGEPPLFLASSALFAIREAIKSARRDAGVEESFRLNAPASADKIRMACHDQFTARVKKVKEGEPTWNVIL